MRLYTEPTCRHLLRQPLLFGVPFPALLLLSSGTIFLQVLAQGDLRQSLIGIGISSVAYLGLRAFTRFSKIGWDEAILFRLERLFAERKGSWGKLQEEVSPIEVFPPDTLDDSDLIRAKVLLEEETRHLKPDETLTLRCRVDQRGAQLSQVQVVKASDKIRTKKDLTLVCQLHGGCPQPFIYSLIQIPVHTDPLWIFSRLQHLKQNFEIIISLRGIEQSTIKARIETVRRLNLYSGKSQEVDADISFEEASHVLRGLSRGDECVLDFSLIILSQESLPLDPLYFHLEKKPALTLLSTLGLRRRFHRSHYVRSVTAADLIPHVFDPLEEGCAILKTLRGKPLYFDPQDSRLDALHWLVAGATGTGKSFFVGLVLWRMMNVGRKLSVLFIDHKRSFKRLVQTRKGTYLEPISFSELQSSLPTLLQELNQTSLMIGIELSELPLSEKKQSAVFVLQQVAQFLSQRTSSHPLYIVMDESWKFLKDDPQGVQEAFREFRKYDAAAIAITQSLKDFISNETGQSIIQNADITVLLRQKEDVTQYKDILDLTEAEMDRVKRIHKKKGIYSECLIKTPFLSRFGRLYPSPEEHEILRTDNLRAERVAEAQILSTSEPTENLKAVA